MTLIWRDSGEYTNGLVTNYFELADLGLIPNFCLPAPSHLPEILLDISTETKPNDFFYAGNLFIISQALKDILIDIPDKIEFHELSVTQLGKEYSEQKYFYANILEEVCCFDYEKSKYTQKEKGIDKIEHLVLQETKSLGHHLFRLGPVPKRNNPHPDTIKEIYRCTSVELALKIISAGITGVTFVRPEDARKYPAENVAWSPESPNSN